MRDYLTDQETAKLLGKRIDQLYLIVDAFDAIPNDQWELTEGEHFEFVSTGTDPLGRRKRRFTEEGVEALARYLESTETQGLLKNILDKLTNWKTRRKQLLVSRRITQEFLTVGESLVFSGNRAFVPKKTTVAILQTNHKGFNNAWGRVRTAGQLEGSEAIELDKHFTLDDEKNLYFSEMGIARIAMDMKQNSTINQSRKAWMDAVGEVVERCFQAEVKHLQAAPKRIDEAVKKAKRAAKWRCEVTGQSKKAHNSLELDGHHRNWTAIIFLIGAIDLILQMRLPISLSCVQISTTSFIPGRYLPAVVRRISSSSSLLCVAIYLIRSIVEPWHATKGLCIGLRSYRQTTKITICVTMV